MTLGGRFNLSCVACGKSFLTSYMEGGLYCSVGCQVHDDPIEPAQRPQTQSRPARTIQRASQQQRRGEE
jgi:hypothetical protein